MGYTVTIKVPDKATGDAIVAFCWTRLRGWNDIVNAAKGVGEKLPSERFFRGSLWARRADNDGVAKGCDGLSYCRRKLHVGFDYNCGTGEREYLYCLIRWMAVKWGDRSESGNPRYLYDGDEWTDVEPSRYDFLGMSKRSETGINADLVKHDMDWIRECCGVDFDAVVRAEMKRLDALWEAERKESRRREGLSDFIAAKTGTPLDEE